MIDDVLGPDLDVLFCGINPGLMSEAKGRHFARPGNRFWPALHLSGFTPRRLTPDEQHLLPLYGLGITNIVARPSATAAELTPQELRDGAVRLAELVERTRPKALAVLGISAYRTGFARPKAVIGPQDDLVAGARVWALPNPSGLNAHWSLDGIAAQLAQLRSALDLPPRSGEETGGGE
ncbi:G/U mismatch-specific DNA glycosylase [Nonomuraea soli]|uniref:TDG/mug DNA glycosylase family protein n=1 Tax=Nonomuraea soli TaxID=1032476 RepID=A0A7W0CNL2_9ACTN|nr:G/U mismatch-specific DNA glycosylase [Nonomuraea soli]MBA2894462.1 TDG/mug DNA glycosylase family protein [Nonomuraea soli]